MSVAAASFAEAYRTLAAAQRRTVERRRFRRIALPLSGRMMDARGREFDCRTADISPGDARIISEAEIGVGDKIVFYLSELGRLEGVVARRCAENEYAILIAGSHHKREKLTEILTLLANRAHMGAENLRPGLSRKAGAAEIRLEDGGLIAGEIVDFSLVGLAVRTRQPRPPIGAWVRVGHVDGRVSRYFEEGFAIDFEGVLPLRPDRPQS